MNIKRFIQLVEQADIPNMKILGQLDDGFAYIQYNGMAGVLDQQGNKMILISPKAPDSFHIVTVANGRESTQYVGGRELGPATKKALDSITPRARSEENPLPVQESYRSTDQVRSIVQRMMEDARVPQKPRQGPLRPQTGAGKHKDKKKDQKQGKEKHKGKSLDESTFPFAGLGKHKIGRAGQLRSPGPTGYPKGKLVGGAAESRFSRGRDDQFSLGGRMPRTDRIDRDSSSGQDAQQRMERKLKQQTIDRLLDRHPEWERSDLELASLPELIQMLRESQPSIDKNSNTTDRYQAGPIDMSITKNAQGQPVHQGGTYRVNKTASINVDVPYKGGKKGITTMVGKADDPEDLDHLMGAGASAERKGVDPKAFARFQQGVREAAKKPNATTRHLRDYPVSDKDVAKPVKKPEKKKPEQGVSEASSLAQQAAIAIVMKKAGKKPKDVSEETLEEAEKNGKRVQLNKPFRTSDGKGKFAVYAKNEKGNVVKVNFGDTTGLTIKTSNPDRRRNFRARHNCDNPGPRHKARFWSCKSWSRGTVSKGLGI